MDNYIKKIRTKIGHQKIIHPAARIIIEDEQGDVLMIKRADNNNWGIPAGSLELGETIKDCIIREVKEETGLQIIDCQVIGVSSNPEKETVIYPNKDIIQYFTIEFYSDNWSGRISGFEEQEVKLAQFVPKEWMQELPKNEQSTFESLAYFKKHQKMRLT